MRAVDSIFIFTLAVFHVFAHSWTRKYNENEKYYWSGKNRSTRFLAHRIHSEYESGECVKIYIRRVDNFDLQIFSVHKIQCTEILILWCWKKDNEKQCSKSKSMIGLNTMKSIYHLEKMHANSFSIWEVWLWLNKQTSKLIDLPQICPSFFFRLYLSLFKLPVYGTDMYRYSLNYQKHVRNMCTTYLLRRIHIC